MTGWEYVCVYVVIPDYAHTKATSPSLSLLPPCPSLSHAYLITHTHTSTHTYIHKQTITTENDLTGKDGKYDLKAKISGKYKHGATGFSVDKLQLKETGGLVGEFSLANVAPGLVFTFKGEEKPTGELGVEYTGARFAIK